MSRRRMLLPLVVALVAVGSIGCAGDSNGAGGGDKVDVPDSKFEKDTGEDVVRVAVVDNTFEAPYVMVSPGTKVLWTNEGRNQHNVQPATPGAFDGVATTDFPPGQSYSETFSDAGDYPYFCSIHGTKNLSGQSGVIRVVADDAS